MTAIEPDWTIRISKRARKIINRLTEEQRACVLTDKPLDIGQLFISPACPGAGKSTGLIVPFAMVRPGVRFLVLIRNKHIKTELVRLFRKYPNVVVHSYHSLAYKYIMGKNSPYSYELVHNDWSYQKHVAKYFEHEGQDLTEWNRNKLFRFVLASLRLFCTSAEPALTDAHLEPTRAAMERVREEQLKQNSSVSNHFGSRKRKKKPEYVPSLGVVQSITNRLIEDIKSEKFKLVTHDVYFKLFELFDIRLGGVYQKRALQLQEEADQGVSSGNENGTESKQADEASDSDSSSSDDDNAEPEQQPDEDDEDCDMMMGGGGSDCEDGYDDDEDDGEAALGFHAILSDEGQDLSPVVIKPVLSQKLGLLVVGDPPQECNQWLGTCEPLKAIEGQYSPENVTKFPLSVTFRCKADVVLFLNHYILEATGEALTPLMKSYETLDTVKKNENKNKKPPAKDSNVEKPKEEYILPLPSSNQNLFGHFFPHPSFELQLRQGLAPRVAKEEERAFYALPQPFPYKGTHQPTPDEEPWLVSRTKNELLFFLLHFLFYIQRSAFSKPGAVNKKHRKYVSGLFRNGQIRFPCCGSVANDLARLQKLIDAPEWKLQSELETAVADPLEEENADPDDALNEKEEAALLEAQAEEAEGEQKTQESKTNGASNRTVPAPPAAAAMQEKEKSAIKMFVKHLLTATPEAKDEIGRLMKRLIKASPLKQDESYANDEHSGSDSSSSSDSDSSSDSSRKRQITFRINPFTTHAIKGGQGKFIYGLSDFNKSAFRILIDVLTVRKLKPLPVEAVGNAPAAASASATALLQPYKRPVPPRPAATPKEMQDRNLIYIMCSRPTHYLFLPFTLYNFWTRVRRLRDANAVDAAKASSTALPTKRAAEETKEDLEGGASKKQRLEDEDEDEHEMNE